MLLRLQKFDITLKYRPGREMVLADSLSRLPMNRPTDQIPLEVCVSLIQFSRKRLEELREATKTDPTLNKLAKYIINGFPEFRRNTHQDTHNYWSFRDELSIEDGVILKGSQAIIPESLRPQYLSDVHVGHQGVTRCQQRARSCIYWPRINEDVETLVATCEPCQKYQKSQAKEKPIPIANELPNVPWYTLGDRLPCHF